MCLVGYIKFNFLYIVDFYYFKLGYLDFRFKRIVNLFNYAFELLKTLIQLYMFVSKLAKEMLASVDSLFFFFNSIFSCRFFFYFFFKIYKTNIKNTCLVIRRCVKTGKRMPAFVENPGSL